MNPHPNDLQSVINTIATLLSQRETVSAMDNLLVEEYRRQIKGALTRMRRKTAYITVIGSQGCGKSTLLNGLIFSSHILPIGEGVTTNVLCFIHGTDQGREYCRITFQNGTSREHPLTMENLRDYMDERQNPHNEKQVSRVDCYTSSDLLSENTCFVDTLGMGSLLTWQDDVTMSFINEISLGIFVLRTTPTLKADQADFLRRIWPGCPEILFIQNVWGESPAEVEAATQDNLRKLNALAAELGIKHPVQLLTVDIHSGLNPGSSGGAGGPLNYSLDQLSTLVKRRVDRGGQRLEIEVQGGLVIGCLERGIQNGRDKISVHLVKDKEDRAKLLEEIDDAKKRLGDFEEESRKLSQEFRREKDVILNKFARDLEIELEDVRYRFERRLEFAREFGGIGEEYMAKASDTVTRVGSEAYLSATQLYQQYAADSEAKIKSIHRLSLPTLNARSSDSLSAAGEDDQTSFSRIAGRVLYKAGNTGLVGLTAFSVATALGAAAGGGLAAVAAGAAAVPVIGWVVAGAILAGGIFCKMHATARARENLRRDFNQWLREFERDAGSKISAQINSDFDVVHKAGSTAIQAAIAQMQETLESILQQLRSKEDVSEEQVAKWKQKIAMLEHAITGIARELEHMGV